MGANDLFVEEDVDYVRLLIDAGVATELQVVRDAHSLFSAI